MLHEVGHHHQQTPPHIRYEGKDKVKLTFLFSNQPDALTIQIYSLSRGHNPLWICIHSPLAGFSLLFRGF